MIKYSLIILLEEVHEDFHQFIQKLYELFRRYGKPFEMLVIANGTGWFLRNEMHRLSLCFDDRNGCFNGLKAFELNRKTTQAVCLKMGFKESRGETIVVCGSYQQIRDESLIQLLRALDDDTDIVNPWRQRRIDPSFNQLQSTLFNAVVRKMAKGNLHDLSCTVKVFRREVLEETELYGNMYRFLPILAMKKGFRSKEVKCLHHQERGKTGFYSLSDYITRIIDIFTLYFNTRFTRKPLRFFSVIGLSFLITGLIVISYVLMQRFLAGQPIGGSPVLLLAVFFMVMGVQAAGVGLLGEVIVFTHGRMKKEYTIEKMI